MLGDAIHLKPYHLETAKAIFALLQASLPPIGGGRFSIAVGGESGSGKSVTAVGLQQVLQEHGYAAVVLHQDDYFRLPPATNHARREADISWVGPSEVQMGLLQAHVQAFKAGAKSLVKPLVHYADDYIGTETLPTEGAQIILVEGTYTLYIPQVDKRVFMSRDYTQTYAQRAARGREAMSAFVESVLEIEHRIIEPSGATADIVVDNDYRVSGRELAVS